MPKTRAQARRQQVSFLCLPPEICQEIYLYLLRPTLDRQHIYLKSDPWSHSLVLRQIAFPDTIGNQFLKGTTGILMVSRQISEETLNVLYGHNIFVMLVADDDDSELCQRFVRSVVNLRPANLRRIRHLNVLAQRRYLPYSYPMCTEFDLQRWMPLLAGLKQLRLVTYLYRSKKYDPCLINYVRKDWAIWLEDALQYLPRNFSETAIVGFDDMQVRVEGVPVEVVQICFCFGYEKGQTAAGHILLDNKGMFTEEFWALVPEG